MDKTTQIKDFLKKLEVSIKRNQRINLKSFLDEELHNLYRTLLLSEGGSIPRINLTFDKIQNEQLKKTMTLNYYFDHIYVLNLDRRPDRLQRMMTELRNNGIFNWTRFKAIDGSLPPHYDEWQNYRRQRMTIQEKMKYQRKAIASAGSWAILKSMYLMLKEAIEKGYKTILVLQDDLLFHKNFVDEFMKLPETVPKNWKLLYLGATQHNWNHVEFRAKYYFPHGTADGFYAVGIHHTIFKELMNEIIKFSGPVDSGPAKRLQRHYGRQCICMTTPLMIADIRDSDLRNSRNIEVYSKKFRWDLSLYNIPKN
jgi:GR25 family glycosyltransferase involved in LPS biosynthesis